MCVNNAEGLGINAEGPESEDACLIRKEMMHVTKKMTLNHYHTTTHPLKSFREVTAGGQVLACRLHIGQLTI